MQSTTNIVIVTIKGKISEASAQVMHKNLRRSQM